MQLSFSVRLSACIILLLATSCRAHKLYEQYKASTYDFPEPVDTQDHEIEIQKPEIFGDNDDGVFASNDFAGARLSGFSKLNDTLYQAVISPENLPINESPWYAFKIWSSNTRTVNLLLNYTYSKHRYYPKLSTNARQWSNIDTSNFKFLGDSTRALLKIDLKKDTLWIAAQEIIDSRMVEKWCEGLTVNSKVHLKKFGKSKQGRPLLFLDIYQGKKANKETIVLLSRQHPPEVTGFMAMKAFVQELLECSNSADFFSKYRVMVYPLLNPDGVDMGNWRHNAGGIDLNRDWAYYQQPETRAVADHIVTEIKNNNNEVILGLDFHSTWHDVYYTLSRDQINTNIPNFRKKWFERIEKVLGNNYLINEKPAGLGTPVSKGWFFTQFGAEGITYEIGDDTPRDFIQKKGQVSAQEMVNVLLEGKYR